MSDESLFDLYNNLFETRIVTSEADRDIAHRLRYQVYCVETGFLPADENPGGLEIDQYDSHSIQSLLYHKPSGHFAGCVRIILPNLDLPGGGQPARVASTALQGLGDRLPLDRSCEISRFAISKEFRRRQDDTLYPAENPPGETIVEGHRRILPHITLGLMTCVVRMSLEHGMTHLLAIVEPALYRLLYRLGLEFEKVGEPIEFHGLRQPIHTSLERILAILKDRQPEVWDVITDRGRLKSIM